MEVIKAPFRPVLIHIILFSFSPPFQNTCDLFGYKTQYLTG
jgi:hypothetical protein